MDIYYFIFINFFKCEKYLNKINLKNKINGIVRYMMDRVTNLYDRGSSNINYFLLVDQSGVPKVISKEGLYDNEKNSLIMKSGFFTALILMSIDNGSFLKELLIDDERVYIEQFKDHFLIISLNNDNFKDFNLIEINFFISNLSNQISKDYVNSDLLTKSDHKIFYNTGKLSDSYNFLKKE